MNRRVLKSRKHAFSTALHDLRTPQVGAGSQLTLIELTSDRTRKVIFPSGVVWLQGTERTRQKLFVPEIVALVNTNTPLIPKVLV